MRTTLNLAIFVVLAGAAHAACNPTDSSSCPTTCNGTAGSTTPTVISGTAYTPAGVTSISEVCAIQYGATSAQVVDVIWATGANATTTQAILCFMNGGWNSGTQDNCTGAGTTQNLSDAILKVQAAAATPNRVGGKGIIIYLFAYRISTSAAFPAQWQDGKCGGSWFQANGGTSTFIGNTSLVSIWAWSAGGTVGWWLANTPNNAFTWSCPSSAANPSKGYLFAGVATPMSIAYPLGNSMYDGTGCSACFGPPCAGCNTINAGVTAVNDLLNCSSLTTCRTADGGNVSPSSLIAASTSLQPNVFLADGGADPLVIPGNCAQTSGYWGTGGGGNIITPLAQYAALSTPIYPTVFILPGYPHGGDLGCTTTSSGCPNPPYGLASLVWQRSIRWLMGDGVPSAGSTSVPM